MTPRFWALCAASVIAVNIALSAQPAKPLYTVNAIRYGRTPNFPVSNLVPGADPKRTIGMALIYWLIRGQGRTVLVDAGFYRPQFFTADWLPTRNFALPQETLGRLGLKPADVTDIILTHMHFDHADGLDLFPNARVWIQHEEYTYYTGAAWQNQNTHGGIDRDDVLALVRINLAGRVRFVEGDSQEIFPGIRCYTGGKHTFASQYIGVATAAGTVVLASDNLYLYENLDRHLPIAATLDPVANLKAQDRMRSIASEPRLIIPGHDPAEFDRFPLVAPGIVEIK